jgi:phosphoribosylformylglycinamidine synthase
VKLAVVTFPGSNCDEDAVHVARDVLGVAAERVWHKDTALPKGTDLVVLPGGFSYGDALRSGALARFSPVMEAVSAFARRGGLVLGICNGFQILLEAGLLPGAMLQNASTKFVCRMVRMVTRTSSTPFTCLLKEGQELRVPVAHHEGRYHADENTVRALFDEGRVVFTYRSDDNPNGALADIAGIASERKNVLGLMPHPERAAEAVLGSEDGRWIFRSAATAILGGMA